MFRSRHVQSACLGRRSQSEMVACDFAVLQQPKNAACAFLESSFQLHVLDQTEVDSGFTVECFFDV